MTLAHQALVQTLVLVQRQDQEKNLGSRSIPSAVSQTFSATPPPTTSMSTQNNNNNNSGASSPLLFFVALGFGVVFTNLWIIVGVKYCFRYNARNRAIRNGEDPDPIGLDSMPARPHRRRREKKLMTMDDVNERFPLTKYKSWVMSRASEGLPTAGGVTAPPSRAPSLRNVDGALQSVPVEPQQTSQDANGVPAPAVDVKADANSKPVNGVAEEKNSLQLVQTTASTIDKHGTRTSEDEDEDDHIHTAVPPELLTNPGDSCAICIDTLEDDDDIRGLTCGHAFHAGCLDPWLTSRRACCPLCKADYYIPKPRPEGEAAEGERPSRRGNRMPVPPPPAWTGMRAARGLPGRFMSGHPPGDIYNTPPRQGRRRAQQEAAEQAAAAARPPIPGEAPVDGAAGSVPNTSRWRPRNPFSNIQMPSLPGRNRQHAPTQSNVEPSPSQLEAGRPPVV